jgi:hypothetical protein
VGLYDRLVQLGDPIAHARALVRAGRCPACAEPLASRSLFGGAPCARCNTGIDAHVVGVQFANEVEARGRQGLLGLVLAVGLAHLLLGWVPFVGALALLLAAAWIRVGILGPATSMLSPRRRVLTRWTARLVMGAALAVTLVTTEALTLVPVIGLPVKAVLGAAEVALAAWAVATYAHWQLRREAAGEAIEAWEWLILGAAFALLITCVIGLALAFIALASALESVLGWLR